MKTTASILFAAAVTLLSATDNKPVAMVSSAFAMLPG